MRSLMMNDFDMQWKILSESGHSSGKLRVYPDHPLDLFVDYSLTGNREVIIEAKGVPSLSIELPYFENLDVTLKDIPGAARLGLTLMDQNLAKSFSVMCFDIAERSKSVKNNNEAFAIILECLTDWSNLLKRRGKFGLSRNEAMGLWGELFTLEKILQSKVSPEEIIVQGWRGPNGDQRDIGFNNTRVEIKSQLSTKAISLRITSLDQLDDEGNSLNVVLNRISPSESGYSLADLVSRIFYKLETNRLGSLEFERKLMLAEFNSELEVCKELFNLDEQLIYEVINDFPKLTLATVPIGIKAAQYEITGAAISSYQINWEALLGKLNDHS